MNQGGVPGPGPGRTLAFTLLLMGHFEDIVSNIVAHSSDLHF